MCSPPFTRSPARRDDVLAAMARNNAKARNKSGTEAADGESRLRYLEDRLRLIEPADRSGNRIKFALDPLAEYLAGLHAVDTYKESRNDYWEQFLKRAAAMPGPPETTSGFLLAVRDCCLASSDVKVPGPIIEELGKHSGARIRCHCSSFGWNNVLLKTSSPSCNHILLMIASGPPGAGPHRAGGRGRRGRPRRRPAGPG